MSVAPIDLSAPRWYQFCRLPSCACAAAAVGLLVAACSTPNASAPAPSQSLPPATSAAVTTAPVTSPGATPIVAFTSSIAPFRLPAAVSRPTVFAAAGGLLVVGGLTSADSTTEAILSVDLTRGTVNPAGQLPVPVHDAAGAVVNGRNLVFGGGSTAVSSAVQDVTPGTPAQVISHLPQPRADLVAVSQDKAGYVLGGYDGTQGSTSILRTTDGRTFTVVGTIPVSVRYPAVAAIDGSIWLFGGEHAGRQTTDVQQVDLTTGHGRVAGHLPRPLAHAGALTLGGTVFLAGGRTGAATTDIVMRFNPAGVSFTAAGHLPAARSDFGVAVVGDTAYLVGGENPRPVDTVVQARAHVGGTP